MHLCTSGSFVANAFIHHVDLSCCSGDRMADLVTKDPLEWLPSLKAFRDAPKNASGGGGLECRWARAQAGLSTRRDASPSQGLPVGLTHTGRWKRGKRGRSQTL